MTINEKINLYLSKNNSFYRDHYHHVIFALMILIIMMLLMIALVFYQVATRPLPPFYAVQPDGKSMRLTPYQEPNLLPDTILRWASKAATSSYTFDFVNYDKQIQSVRSYYTKEGWRDYQASISDLISTIVQNQLFVRSIVSGTPVISNEGPLPSKGYVVRVEIPFLVTYESSSTTATRNYFVVLSIIRVPTNINPAGISIDQFNME